MKNKKLNQFPPIYFIVILTLGLIIIFESVKIIDTLKNFSTQKNELNSKSQELTSIVQSKKGMIKLILEENQKIIPNKDIKAKVVFSSPEEEIGGIDLILNFDPEFIAIKQIQENKEVFNQIVVNNQQQKQGRIKITAYQPMFPLKNEQTLGFLTFRLLKNQPASIKIEFMGPDVITDSNLVSQKTQKDILEKVQSLSLTPEAENK